MAKRGTGSKAPVGGVGSVTSMSRRAPRAAAATESAELAGLRHQLLANMGDLQRLYEEEKRARLEAESELSQALQLVKQAQAMAAKGRREASAVRRRLVTVQAEARESDAALREQLQRAEQHAAAAPARSGAEFGAAARTDSWEHRQGAAVREELAAPGSKFVRRRLDGWEAVLHDPSGQWCYFHADSGVVSWDLHGVGTSPARSPSPLRQASPPPTQEPAPRPAEAEAPRGGVARWAASGAPSAAAGPTDAKAGSSRPARRVPGQPAAAAAAAKEQAELAELRQQLRDLEAERQVAQRQAAPPPADAPVVQAAASETPPKTPPQPQPQPEPEPAPEPTAGSAAEPAVDTGPPVSEGEVCTLARNAAGRASASLQSELTIRLREGQKVRVLEVACCRRAAPWLGEGARAPPLVSAHELSSASVARVGGQCFCVSACLETDCPQCSFVNRPAWVQTPSRLARPSGGHASPPSRTRMATRRRGSGTGCRCRPPPVR
eukprot:COSAG04_NODE_963_length_9150_cov_8.566788_5_plen_494_part_00